jgi:hypothetical protein
MKRLLQLLVPYFSVGICWCIFKNGWLAILAYHAQVLLWQFPQIVGRERLRNDTFPPQIGRGPFQPYITPAAPIPNDKRWLLAALPTILGGPLVYFLLPHITHTDIGTWLAEYKLTGVSLLLMIPYFGIIHPMLEQLHWKPLREQTPLAHVFFAGYHMMVLASLITVPWLIFCFAALAVASVAWQFLTTRSGSLIPSTLSHIFADLGIILTAFAIVSN